MNTTEAPKANGSGGFSPAAGPLPESDPFFIGDRITAKSPRTRSRGVLRRLAGRWWQILLLWLIISSPIIALIYASIKPTYVASSLLEIEPVQNDIFAPLQRNEPFGQDLNYLRTQVNLIISNPILEQALANPSVVYLPVIMRFEDPRKDLREKLNVEIIGDTNLIRVALELPDRGAAIAIVNAVTQAYRVQSVDFARCFNRMQTDSFEEQLMKISKDIESQKRTLKDFIKHRTSVATNPGEMLNPKAETDPTQPTLNKVTKQQFERLIEKQVQCDLDYLDAMSELEAVKGLRARDEDKISAELNSRVAEEFKENPNVVALLDQIHESEDLGKLNDHAPSPAMLAAREKLAKLTTDYNELWASEFPELRRRLVDADQGRLSEARIQELELAVEKARTKKVSFAQQLGKIQVIDVDPDVDISESKYVNYSTREPDAMGEPGPEKP